MPVNVVIQGFGAMGRAAMHALDGRSDAHVVAVLDTHPGLVGRPVGEILPSAKWPDVIVQHPRDADLRTAGAQVAVHATTAFAADTEPQIGLLLEAGCDVVTLCQELVHPRGENTPIAARIDAAARAAGRSVVAGGVNPGWILDLVPIAASLGCVDIRSAHATRIVDFSPYGPDEMLHIGAGLDEEAFRAGTESGEIGHIGLLESAAMVAHSLGLAVDEWTQTKEPEISEGGHETPFIVVPAGRARGFRQRVVGRGDGSVLIDFRMVGLLDVRPEAEPLGDRIEISATPNISLTIHGDDTSDGGRATAGVVTNLIGPVLAATPGLHTVATLPLARSRRALRIS